MLQAVNISSGYGGQQVIDEISLSVHDSEIVALIGPNGSGKSTLLKAVSGVIPIWTGSIQFEGIDISHASVWSNLVRGIILVPQGRRVFPELTVIENLVISVQRLNRESRSRRLQTVLNIFPELRSMLAQSAGTLSGGEQQMVSLSRALMCDPKFLLLDEPTLGLSPKNVASIFNRIVEINRLLGVSVLIVEHRVRDVLAIAPRVYGLKLGLIAHEGPSKELLQDDSILRRLFL